MLLVALALAASACVGGGTDEPRSAAPDQTTATIEDRDTAGPGEGAALPVDPAGATFVESACEIDVPAGTSPRCGTVAVPEDWATGTGAVTLAVAVFPGTGASAAPDPVIYLEGGPGGHSLDTIQFIRSDLLEPLQARGDVVFLDQRGVGRSRPRLHCEEVTALTRELEDVPLTPDDEADTRFGQALAACRARLEGEGVDLTAYHTINNAHDVEAVRAALGYEQWNLYGISYGTKLALEVMRQHPDGVRTVVIDSVFPAEVDSTRDNPQTFVASYRAVVAACAQEPACAAAGDLAQRFEAVVAAYDAEPLQVEIQDFVTGATDQVYVNGETIVGVVAQALYSPEQFSDLPELVGELEQARTDAVVAYLSQQRSNEPFFSSGMFYAFECNEEIPFADPAEVTAAMPPDPFGRKATFDYASNNGPAAFATCAAFDSRAGAAPPDPEANQAVVSDTPTLVMAGRFDPVTPVAWAEQAAANLAGSHLVVAPLGSHGISPGRCGMDVIRQFLDQPEQAPDASCFEGADLAFLSAPEAEEVVLEEVTFPSVDPSLTVTTVRPRDWVHTDLDGNSLRQRSFLDPTEIVQLAGDSTLAAGLASYLATSLDVELSPPMPVDRFERTWRYRTGRTASEAVEWYETEIDGHVTIVILISALAELEANVGAVLDPALDNISVSG